MLHPAQTGRAEAAHSECLLSGELWQTDIISLLYEEYVCEKLCLCKKIKNKKPTITQQPVGWFHQQEEGMLGLAYLRDA